MSSPPAARPGAERDVPAGHRGGAGGASLFTLKLDSATSSDELGRIEAELERMLCVVAAARCALLELEDARNGNGRIEAGV